MFKIGQFLILMAVTAGPFSISMALFLLGGRQSELWQSAAWITGFWMSLAFFGGLLGASSDATE